jgi:hypothetical protein
VHRTHNTHRNPKSVPLTAHHSSIALHDPEALHSTMLATVFNDPEVASIHKRSVRLCQQLLEILANDVTYLSEELHYWRK